MRFRFFVPWILHCFFRMAIRLSLLALLTAVSLASCRTPVLIWNDNGKGMTDLRSLRHHARQHVELSPGVTLYADEIRYSDKKKHVGEAMGHVLFDVDPAVRYECLLEYGYAGRASFDRKQRYVILADHPMIEREFMTQIATAPYTTIEVRWDTPLTDVVLHGPTRTDFAKSHPKPPEVVLPTTRPAPEPVRKTLPLRGLSKH